MSTLYQAALNDLARVFERIDHAAVERADAYARDGVWRVSDAGDAAADDRPRWIVRRAWLSMDTGAVKSERAVLRVHQAGRRDWGCS